MEPPADDISASSGLFGKAYTDLLSPSATELGITVHRALRVALSPVNGTLWTFEQGLAWVERQATERLTARHVPPASIVAPRPELLGAVVIGIQASAGDSDLGALFSNLLATAMEPEKDRLAHPAFADIIRQLLPDEARIALELANLGIAGRPIRVQVEMQADRASATFERYLSSLATQAKCTSPELLPSYIDNLCRLGLVRYNDARAKWSAVSEGHAIVEPALARLSLEASDDRAGVRCT